MSCLLELLSKGLDDNVADMLHQYYRCSNNESLDELEKLSLTHPDRADVHYRLGVEYLRLLQCNKAIEHLGIACKYEPDNLSARLALAAAYDEMGQTEKALENLKKCQNCRPDELYDTDRIVSHNGLGAMYQAHGKYEDAMQAFDKALSLIEKNHSDCSLADCAVAYNGLGSVYQSQGRYEDAIRAFGKAMHIISKSKNKMGKDYPYIAITAYSGLALTDKDGKKDEYFKKALDISISKFGEEHPKTKLVKALIKKEQEKQN